MIVLSETLPTKDGESTVCRIAFNADQIKIIEDISEIHSCAVTLSNGRTFDIPKSFDTVLNLIKEQKNGN